MSNTIGNIIADSLNLGLGYADRILKDIPAEKFARFASGIDGPITSNHPAFVFGHLCIYAPRVLEQLGRDNSRYIVPDTYDELFSPSAVCEDDSDGSKYPPMDSILAQFRGSYDAAKQALRDTDDAVFTVPNPGEGRMKELFPTLGSMHAFYVGGHFMVHMGQISAWRRMMGMPAA